MNCTGNPEVLYHGRGYSNRSFITLQGCTSSHMLSPLTAVYTTCTRQPSSGSPTRVSATAYLNTQVSSPGLSPIQVPSAGSPAEVSTYNPERCVQGSRDTKRAPGTPCHVPTASQPTPRVSAARGLQHTTNTRTTCNSWTKDNGG